MNKPVKPTTVYEGGSEVVVELDLDALGKTGKEMMNTWWSVIELKGAGGVSQVIVAPRLRHSAKPPETRDRIVRLCGDVPRVELFARDTAPGWDRWGNEVPSTITLESLAAETGK